MTPEIVAALAIRRVELDAWFAANAIKWAEANKERK